MKSNRIVSYRINGKYQAFYLVKGEKYLIESKQLPNTFVQALMDKENANNKEIKSWVQLNYVS